MNGILSLNETPYVTPMDPSELKIPRNVDTIVNKVVFYLLEFGLERTELKAVQRNEPTDAKNASRWRPLPAEVSRMIRLYDTIVAGQSILPIETRKRVEYV